MATIIRVTTATLRERAEALRTLNERFRTEVNALNDREKQLLGMYEGDASKAFDQQFQIDKSKFDVFYAGINHFIQRLLESADAYDRAEQQNVGVAQTRKA